MKPTSIPNSKHAHAMLSSNRTDVMTTNKMIPRSSLRRCEIDIPTLQYREAKTYRIIKRQGESRHPPCSGDQPVHPYLPSYPNVGWGTGPVRAAKHYNKNLVSMVIWTLPQRNRLESFVWLIEPRCSVIIATVPNNSQYGPVNL
jgi:hypothetical protein